MALQDAETVWCGKPTKTVAKKITIALYRWVIGLSTMEKEVLFSRRKKAGTR